MLKKTAITIGVLLLVLLVAVIAIPALVNWNNYKDEIASVVRDATGRDLTIDGDIDVSLFPSITFSAADVSLANAPGFEPKAMAKVGLIEGRIRILPLIGGTVVVERLRVMEPEAVLQIDADGQPNWAFEPTAKETANPTVTDTSKRGFVDDVHVEDAKVEGGRFSFVDDRTGQKIDAKDIRAVLAVPSLDQPVSFEASAVINEDNVTASFALDTPRRLMEGGKAAVKVALKAPKAELGYAGGLQRRPVPGLDGTFSMNIPSVGATTAWLGRPLPAQQPDPGSLKARAVFTADGPRIALTEAVIEGNDLNARASGSADLSGPAPKIALKVDSGVLNVDRYLPPPAKEEVKTLPPAPSKARGPFAGLSDEALNLEMLRQGTVDVEITIAGLKAMGVALGPTVFAAHLADGKLVSELSKLELYGGKVTGKLVVDGTGDTLVLDTDAAVSKVDLGKLSHDLTQGEPAVTGVVSADLKAHGEGKSQKALAESLKGHLGIDLGGLETHGATPGTLSGLQLGLELPGIQDPPTLAATFVYNKEKVALKARTSPLPQLVSADRFDLNADLTSRMMNAAYAGAVLKNPVAGLDGTFTLDAPSAARLAAWLGRPLEGQPDPGPLKARATFAADGGKAVLREATIDSAAIKATATGTWAKKGPISQLSLAVKGGVLDLDKLLGPPAKETAKPAAAVAAAKRPGPLAALPAEPIDVSDLRTVDADVKVDFAGLQAGGQTVGRIAVATRIERGIATVKIDEIALYGGKLAGTVRADARGKAIATEATLTATGLRVGDLLAPQPPMTGTLAVDAALRTQGASPRTLAENVAGTLNARLLDGKSANGGPPISDLVVAVDMPGLGTPATVQADGTYNGEKVAATVSLADLQGALAGRAFPVTAKITGPSLTAGFDGKVQQTPAPGLDGTMNTDVASVGKLAAWLGQPLQQPDPGALKVTAILAADGNKTALKDARIEGKAIRATAQGSFDAGATPRRFDAKLTVQEADLDAYLPPSGNAPKANAGQPAAPRSEGWSTDPIDLSPLRDNHGAVEIALNAIRYRGLTIQSGRLNAAIDDGTLTASVADIKLADGSVAAKVTLADTGKGARLAFDATVAGVNARPLLTAFAGTDRLSGTTAFQAKGAATGRSQKDLVSTLDGNGSFKFVDGAIWGINIASVLRQVGSLGTATGQEQKTDFAELSGSFRIDDGVVRNDDLKMLAPLLRVGGKGTISMPPQTLDYLLEATLVGSLKGQGGKDDLSGIPVPIRVNGTWAAPQFDVQWDRMLQGLATNPDALKNLPGSLKDMLGGSGIKIPGLGGSSESSDGKKPGVTGDALRGILGGGTQPGKSPTTKEPPAAEPTPKSPVDQGQQLLKGLFGR